jgi:hypothetical protein
MFKRITLLNTSEYNELSNIAILRSMRGHTKISFIVDTGSPSTVIPYDFAKQLNISLNELPTCEEIGILGVRNKMYRFSRRIQISFICEDGTALTATIDPLIARPIIKESEKTKQNILTEVLIGLDFLLKNKFKLFCDMDKREAYLEASE